MSLSAFIRNNMTKILAEWTAFAEKTAPPEGEMTKLALTDHAQQILNAIALDIDTHQSDQQQYDKSQGEDIDLNAEESAAAITLKVANIGPVIPAESLQTIFQPLVQLEPAGGPDARPKTSLGLGLFIAQEITAAHGGTIGVRVPLSFMFDYLRAGESLETFIEHFPSVPKDVAIAALNVAEQLVTEDAHFA